MHEPLFGALASLRDGWPARGWSWDSRLACVSSSFPGDVAETARAAAKASLTFEWDAKSLSRAPREVADLAEQSGGLRSGQYIFTTAVVGGAIAFGLWWPWNDDVTTSLRAGLAGARVSGEELRLQEIFNVTL